MKKEILDNFNGKTVLITGAGKGLGREMAILFSKKGNKFSDAIFTRDLITESHQENINE